MLKCDRAPAPTYARNAFPTTVILAAVSHWAKARQCMWGAVSVKRRARTTPIARKSLLVMLLNITLSVTQFHVSPSYFLKAQLQRARSRRPLPEAERRQRERGKEPDVAPKPKQRPREPFTNKKDDVVSGTVARLRQIGVSFISPEEMRHAARILK